MPKKSPVRRRARRPKKAEKATAEFRAKFLIALSLLLAVSIAGGAAVRAVQAATFQGPSQNPPGGNIPVTIWNSVATGTLQTAASITVDGGGPAGTNPVGLSVGAMATDLGNAAGGQNVIYGVGDPAKMHAADYLLLLQAPAGTNRLSIDENGNAVASGTVTGGNLATSGAGNLTVGGRSTLGSATLNLIAGQRLIFGNIDTASVGDLVLLQNESVDQFRVDATGNTTIDGMTVFGSAGQVVGAAQNLLYGNVDTTSTGNILLLQNESVDRFKVDAAGNATAAGNVNADQCFGPAFIGRTALAYTGNLNGGASTYVNANTLCQTAFSNDPRVHVCSIAEILNSIKCSTAGSPVRNQAANADGWVVGGPPGFTAPANDCQGWTSNNSGHLGRIWRFNTSSPASSVGMGFLSTCNQSIPFACCR